MNPNDDNHRRSSRRPSPLRHRWKIIQSLSHNDIISINELQYPLQITAIRPNKDKGKTTLLTATRALPDDSSSTSKQFDLEVSNDTVTEPVLIHPNDHVEPITYIEPMSETIITTQISKSLIQTNITADIRPEPELDNNHNCDTDTCPRCECDIIEQDLENAEATRILCTGCGEWTWKSQYRAYTNQRGRPNNKIRDPNVTQLTLQDMETDG